MTRTTIVMLVCTLFLNSCNLISLAMPCEIEHRDLELGTRANLLWSIEGIYVPHGHHVPLAKTTPGHFYVQAVDTGSSKLTINAYEVLTGSLLWSRKINDYYEFVVNDQSLIIGTHSGIVLYDANTGEIQKKVHFPQSINIMYMYDYSGNIFVYDSGGKFYSYNRETQTLATRETNLSRTTFVEDQSTKYVEDPDGFKAIDINTERVLWNIDFDGGLEPIFSDEMVFVLVSTADLFVSNLYALDKKTGEILWKSQLNIISSVAVTASNVYFLTRDGNLIMLDKYQGSEVVRVPLSNHDFISPYYPSPKNAVGAYTVSVDPESSVVIVSLGDSCQLFAIQINP